MRRAFDTVSIRGTVVIGEGERDEAPMLFIGEQVGLGWHHDGQVLCWLCWVLVVVFGIVIPCRWWPLCDGSPLGPAGNCRLPGR